jgi:hypothetical protein
MGTGAQGLDVLAHHELPITSFGNLPDGTIVA